MDAPRPVSYDMSHYFGMLRRHWWIIALLTAVGIAGALGLAGTQPRVYDSTTYVLVMPTGSANASVEGGRTSGAVNLDTEAQLVTSADVAAEAAKLLRITTAPSDLAAAVSVDVPANTSVMAITFAGSTPTGAQAGSHAFATAYLGNRQGSAQADITGQVNAINVKIRQQQASLARINNDLARLNAGSAKYANAQSQRQTLNSQINTLTNRINNLATTTVTSGKIITDAGLPTKPTKPSVPLFLTSGAMVGILFGVAFAVARQRSDKKVRFPTDVPRRSGLPLLAQLPARVKPRFDDVFPPYGTGGRTFNRLRNEVLATLRENDKVIVVTGASKGCASTLVAANLASALARAGSEVVLVCAHLPEVLGDGASAPSMLGVAATPGLSDVLAGKVPLDTATQRAPRNPWLRVITTGGTASATGFLQSQTLRDILAQLRTQAEYIVIEAPSTANSADAQSLASLADAAIVVVKIRRTTHTEVLDAADQLARVTTSMLGSVVLPRLRRTGEDVPTPPPPGRPVGAGVVAQDGPHVEALPTTPMSALRQSTPRGGGADGVAAQNALAQNVTAREAAIRAAAAHDRAAETVVSEGALGLRQVGNAAEAAVATSAAASGTADSFFAGDPADEAAAGPRRRILPGRRSPIRNAPPRRPSPVRSSVRSEGSDETVTFDAPVRVEAGAIRADAAHGDAARADAAPDLARAEAIRMDPAPVMPHQPTASTTTPASPHSPAQSKPQTMPHVPSPGPNAGPPKVNEGTLPSTRTVPSVTLPDKTINRPPANPTHITSPVLGATSIVVKPTTGGVASPPSAPLEAPVPAAPEPTTTETAGAGTRPVGVTGPGAVTADLSEASARITAEPGTGIQQAAATQPVAATGSPAAGSPATSSPAAASPMTGSPANGAVAAGAVPTGSPVTGALPTGSPAGGAVAIGSKSVPGAKAAIGEPLVGSAGDTVSFKRIDLVYVEDGETDGRAR